MCNDPTPQRWELPADPRAASQARRLLSSSLCPSQRADADSAVLLVSELVTNAVRYGAAPIVLLVRCDTLTGVHVEVSDAGPPWQPTITQPGAQDEGGRGLTLVDQLSSRTGHTIDHRGTTAWFDLDSRAAEVA